MQKLPRPGTILVFEKGTSPSKQERFLVLRIESFTTHYAFVVCGKLTLDNTLEKEGNTIDFMNGSPLHKSAKVCGRVSLDISPQKREIIQKICKALN